MVSEPRRRLRKRIDEANYPAPFRAIDAIAIGLSRGMEDGLLHEAELLGRLASGSTSRNLVALLPLRR